MMLFLQALDSKAWGMVFCAVAYTAAAAMISRRFVFSARNVSLLLACVVATGWAVVQLARFRWPVVAQFDILLNASWLVFVASCLSDHTLIKWIRSHLAPALLIGIGVIVVPLEITQASHEEAVFLVRFALDVLVLFFLENIVRNTPEDFLDRRIVLTLVIGLLSIYDLVYCGNQLMFPNEESWLTAWRGYVIAAGAPFMALGRLDRQDRRTTSELALSRHAIFHSTVLLGTGLYLLVMSFAGQVLKLNEGYVGILVEIALLFAGMVSLLAVLRSASVRARFMVFIGKHFFRLKYDYREVWLNFIRRMATPDARENLHERALRAMADAVHCRSGALWTFQHPLETYVGTAQWEIDDALPMIPSGDSLTEFLIETGWIIDVRQCLKEPDVYSGLSLPLWIARQPGLWVIVPLIHNRVLEGFVVLGEPRSRPAELTWEEFDLLKTVGAQTAGYLAEDRASRELADARRLGEFNRRFAFVIHDIKNVVGQMSLMLQNADRFGDDPQFQRDMLDTAASAVERLRGMLVQLGNKPAFRRSEPRQAVDLDELACGVSDRWRRSYGGISFEGAPEPIKVMAVADKVVSILDHLIQNAVDAAGPRGRIRIVLGSNAHDGLVEITDNGPGMTTDFVRNQLFRPFETSKVDGSGLGAFQALRMVREMGGNLEVETQAGQGTTMRVSLPKEVFVSSHAEEAFHVAGPS